MSSSNFRNRTVSDGTEAQELPAFFRALPFTVIIFSLGYIGLALTLSYLIDIQQMNILGLRSWLVGKDYEIPLLWFHIFREAHLTENIQWLFLGASVVGAGRLGMKHLRQQSHLCRIWFLLSGGIFLMLLEDAANIRHHLTTFIGAVYFEVDPDSLAWRTGWPRTFIEFAFFTVVGIIMVATFIYILKNIRPSSSGVKLLTAGYLTYGIATVFSATRNMGNWYAEIGGRILNQLTAGASLGWTGETTAYDNPLGFWFMDFVVEESLELLGAAFLLAAVAVFTVHLNRQQPGGGK